MEEDRVEDEKENEKKLDGKGPSCPIRRNADAAGIMSDGWDLGGEVEEDKGGKGTCHREKGMCGEMPRLDDG